MAKQAEPKKIVLNCHNSSESNPKQIKVEQHPASRTFFLMNK